MENSLSIQQFHILQSFSHKPCWLKIESLEEQMLLLIFDFTKAKFASQKYINIGLFSRLPLL